MLTTSEFADAVRKGKGRAVLAVNGPVSQEFEDIILAACHEDQRCDSQLEDNRTTYLMMLADHAGITEKLLESVLKPMKRSLDDWDRLLRIRILGQFAERGNEHCLGILRNLAQKSDTYAWDVLANSGDLEWLVVHILPTMPLDEKWRTGFWLEENPGLSEKAANALRAADAELEPIRTKNLMESETRELPKFDEALRKIKRSKRIVAGLTRLARSLTEEQLSQVAQLWLREREHRKARNYLRLIEGRQYPLPISDVIDLVKEGGPPIAFEEVLSEISHELVREFGLDLISGPAPDYRGFLCLRKSYLDSDLPIIVSNLERFWDLNEDDLHSLAIHLRELCETMTPTERLPLMLWNYEHSPCSACRGWSAEILIEDRTLPPHYLEEMILDADSYSRELASKER